MLSHHQADAFPTDTNTETTNNMTADNINTNITETATMTTTTECQPVSHQQQQTLQIFLSQQQQLSQQQPQEPLNNNKNNENRISNHMNNQSPNQRNDTDSSNAHVILDDTTMADDAGDGKEDDDDDDEVTPIIIEAPLTDPNPYVSTFSSPSTTATTSPPPLQITSPSQSSSNHNHNHNHQHHSPLLVINHSPTSSNYSKKRKLDHESAKDQIFPQFVKRKTTNSSSSSSSSAFTNTINNNNSECIVLDDDDDDDDDNEQQHKSNNNNDAQAENRRNSNPQDNNNNNNNSNGFKTYKRRDSATLSGGDVVIQYGKIQKEVIPRCKTRFGIILIGKRFMSVMKESVTYQTIGNHGDEALNFSVDRHLLNNAHLSKLAKYASSSQQQQQHHHHHHHQQQYEQLMRRFHRFQFDFVEIQVPKSQMRDIWLLRHGKTSFFGFNIRRRHIIDDDSALKWSMDHGNDGGGGSGGSAHDGNDGYTVDKNEHVHMIVHDYGNSKLRSFISHWSTPTMTHYDSLGHMEQRVNGHNGVDSAAYGGGGDRGFERRSLNHPHSQALAMLKASELISYSQFAQRPSSATTNTTCSSSSYSFSPSHASASSQSFSFNSQNSYGSGSNGHSQHMTSGASGGGSSRRYSQSGDDFSRKSLSSSRFDQQQQERQSGVPSTHHHHHSDDVMSVSSEDSILYRSPRKNSQRESSQRQQQQLEQVRKNPNHWMNRVQNAMAASPKLVALPHLTTPPSSSPPVNKRPKISLGGGTSNRTTKKDDDDDFELDYEALTGRRLATSTVATTNNVGSSSGGSNGSGNNSTRGKKSSQQARKREMEREEREMDNDEGDDADADADFEFEFEYNDLTGQRATKTEATTSLRSNSSLDKLDKQMSMSHISSGGRSSQDGHAGGMMNQEESVVIERKRHQMMTRQSKYETNQVDSDNEEDVVRSINIVNSNGNRRSNNHTNNNNDDDDDDDDIIVSNDIKKKQTLTPQEASEPILRVYNIVITRGDLLRCEPGEFLNDNIVDLYYQYITETRFSHSRHCFHIFNSHFYPLLSRDPSRVAKRVPEPEKVKIFEFDMLFLPMCEDEHWTLAVVTGLQQLKDRIDEKLHQVYSVDDSTGKFDINRPRMYICDSLKIMKTSQLKKMSEMIREYLGQRYRVENGPVRSASDQSSSLVTRAELPLNRTDVPQQPNYCDCGLYMLEYTDRLLTERYGHANDPNATAAVTMEKPFQNPNWFRSQIIKEKRKLIKQIIEDKIRELGPAVPSLSLSSTLGDSLQMLSQDPTAMMMTSMMATTTTTTNQDTSSQATAITATTTMTATVTAAEAAEVDTTNTSTTTPPSSSVVPAVPQQLDTTPTTASSTDMNDEEDAHSEGNETSNTTTATTTPVQEAAVPPVLSNSHNHLSVPASDITPSPELF